MELSPLQTRLTALNEWLGDEVIRFNPFDLAPQQGCWSTSMGICLGGVFLSRGVAVYRVSVYDTPVATSKGGAGDKTYGSKDTERIASGKKVKPLAGIERQIQIKLVYLNAAVTLQDLKSPPGNRLEALKGDRAGQHSIRINNQYRICFKWKDGDAYDVEVTDYH